MDGSAPDILLSNVVATAATKLPDKLLPLGIFFGLLVKKYKKKTPSVVHLHVNLYFRPVCL